MQGRLFYGDNLDVLRERISASSIDLVYLDPPFNSNRSYNVIFAQHGNLSVADNAAQIQAFDDTWRWTTTTDEQYQTYTSGALPNRVADALSAFRMLLGENDALAYLVNMAPRLVELHRVLKPTGSLYLHCDPTMSHYLKVLLDAIFGAEMFRDEIVWKRTSGHSDASGYGRVHDVILFYVKTEKAKFNKIHQAYDSGYVEQYYRYTEEGTGRRFMSGDLSAAGLAGGGYSYEWRGVRRVWRCPPETMERYEAQGRIFYTRNGMPRLKRYLDEAKGLPAQDVWTDVEALRSWHAEKLGYPTQKPVALLERILRASSHEDAVVLDPFCGCGTTIDAAVRMDRQWVGIDITYLAVDLIEKRLQHTYGEAIRGTYEVQGIPRDVGSAQALFDRSPFDFERWAVSLVNGTPNEKQVGDRGIDGVVRFFTDAQRHTGRVLVSVKGGRSLGPQFVRDLLGTVETNKAEMGSLITLQPFTRGMADAMNHSGSYVWPINGQRFPRAQILTVPELLAGGKLSSPPTLTPYIPADRHLASFDQLALL